MLNIYGLNDVKYRVLTNVGTFFYDRKKSETHFYPLDSELFFDALASGTTVQKLAEILTNEFELEKKQCIQIATDTLNSLQQVHLITTDEIAA